MKLIILKILIFSSQNKVLVKEPSSNGPRLLLENEELRRRLSVLEGLSKENYRLKKDQQERDVSQMAIASLL